MKKIILFLALAVMVTFTACTSQPGKNNSPAFKEYIELKEALVNSDSLQSKSEAAELQGVLASFKGTETAQQKATEIAATDNLEKQRVLFSQLSESIKELLKSGTIESSGYYIQHCPMAFNDTGADWISDKEEIRNPYFGDQMLECGTVKEEVK